MFSIRLRSEFVARNSRKSPRVYRNSLNILFETIYHLTFVAADPYSTTVTLTYDHNITGLKRQKKAIAEVR